MEKRERAGWSAHHKDRTRPTTRCGNIEGDFVGPARSHRSSRFNRNLVRALLRGRPLVGRSFPCARRGGHRGPPVQVIRATSTPPARECSHLWFEASSTVDYCKPGLSVFL